MAFCKKIGYITDVCIFTHINWHAFLTCSGSSDYYLWYLTNIPGSFKSLSSTLTLDIAHTWYQKLSELGLPLLWILFQLFFKSYLAFLHDPEKKKCV